MTQPKATTKIIGLKQPNNSNKTKTKTTNTTNNKYNPICWRFPSLSVCGCTRPCREAVQTVEIFEIIPGLFVGAVHGAYKHQYLKNKNIKCILNISNEKYFQNKQLFEYLQIDIEDAVTTEIIKHFEITNIFIDQALSSKQGVYVHCRAGISRSPSVIMAYLMWKNGIGVNEADKIVGKVHPDANPNSSFMRQLEQYEKIVKQNLFFKISKKMNLNKLNSNKKDKNDEKDDQ
eukprot:215474_1